MKSGGNETAKRSLPKSVGNELIFVVNEGVEGSWIFGGNETAPELNSGAQKAISGT